jgi:antirestriction protein ArdC
LRWGGTFAIEQETESGEKTKTFRNAGKWLNVFNVACVDDSESDRKIAEFITDTPDRFEFAALAELEQLIEQTGASIRYGGDRAFYAPSLDKIQLPERESFKSAEGFYGTAIHELGHWTGHSSRLDRPLCGQFGSASYAYEELIAELTAAFMGDRFGLSTEIENHASYLENWLKALKDDKKYFFKAASEARKASAFLLGEKAETEDAIAA